MGVYVALLITNNYLSNLVYLDKNIVKSYGLTLKVKDKTTSVV